ncbi:prepilin-type N-terminal cleavage/methylation domain-containing protein [Clostridiales Family XIII bacterium PM5-7]
MKKKMMNKKGFTLSELLMVVLILGLLVTILGSGFGVVKEAYEKVTLKAEAQTLMATTVTKVKDEFRFAREIKTGQLVVGSTPVTTFVSGNENMEVFFTDDTTGNRGILMVEVAKPAQGDEHQSVAIATDKTMTNNLTTSIDYNYDVGTHVITATIQILKVVDSGKTLILEQEIKVKPINK